MLDITLLGTGGVMPLPDRALTALYVRWGSRALLIDCGEGTQVAIRRQGLRFKPIGAIFLTHFHADHISGLPGLLLTMGNEGRREDVTIYGPRGLEKSVGALLSIVGQLPFSVRLETLEGEAARSLEDLTVTSIPLNHGVPCLGYRLDLPRPGRFDPRAASDRGVPVTLWSRLQRGESLEGFTPADVLGPPRRGLRVLYATDTRPVPPLATLGRGADLMILEGMFGDPGKTLRARESCHMTMEEAATLAARAEAKALWLTHYSPATPHPEEYAPLARAVFPNTVTARDGQSLTLRFPDRDDPDFPEKE